MVGGLSALLGFAIPSPSAQAGTVNWLSGTGSWSNPARWLGAKVPGFGSNVIIDKNPAFDSLVVLSGSSPVIGLLRIDAGDALWLQDPVGVTLTVGVVKIDRKIQYGGSLINSGSLQLGSTIGRGTLKVAGQVTLSGSGSVGLLNSAIDSGSGPDGDRLINLNNNIHGTGVIDPSGNLAVTNWRMIQNGIGQTLGLVVSATDNGFVNRGTLLATTGTLNLSCYAPATILNAGGTLMASAGGILNIGPNLTVIGGKIVAKGSSQLTILNSSVNYASISAQTSPVTLSGTLANTPIFLDNANLTMNSGANVLTNVSVTGSLGAQVTMNGGSTQLNNTAFLGVPVTASGAVYVSGALVSTREFTLGSGNGGSALYISGAVRLSGSGSLLLPGTGDAILGDYRSEAPARSTLLNANLTIHGGGILNPTDNLGITNWSLIQTDPGSLFTIVTGSSGPLVNSGTIQALNNGSLNLPAVVSGTINNAGGTIQALNGSSLTIGAGITLNGGILAVKGTSSLVVNPANINSARIVTDHSQLSLSGTVQRTPVLLTSSTLTVAGGANCALKNLSITSGSTSLVNLFGFTDVNNVSFLGGVPIVVPSAVGITGLFTNTGGFNLGPNGSVLFSGVTTLTGYSEFVLGNGSALLADYRSPGTRATLINADNLIHGTGILNPTGLLAIQNYDVIQSGSGEYLTLISATGGALINRGTIEAIDTGGITLRGLGADVTNVGGIIQALNGSQIQIFPGTTVTGGALIAHNGSFIVAQASIIKSASLLADSSLLALTSGSLQNTPVRLVSGTLALQNETLSNLAVTALGSSPVNGTNVELKSIAFMGGPSVSLSGAHVCQW